MVHRWPRAANNSGSRSESSRRARQLVLKVIFLKTELPYERSPYRPVSFYFRTRNHLLFGCTANRGRVKQYTFETGEHPSPCRIKYRNRKHENNFADIGRKHHAVFAKNDHGRVENRGTRNELDSQGRDLFIVCVSSRLWNKGYAAKGFSSVGHIKRFIPFVAHTPTPRVNYVMGTFKLITWKHHERG